MLSRLLLALVAVLAAPCIMAAQQSTRDVENQIKMRVAELWVAADHAALDALAEEYRRTKATVPGGRWKLSVFHEGLSKLVRSYSDEKAAWDEMADRAKRWVNNSPRSSTARIQFVNALLARAWSVRGTDYAGAVPQKQMNFFRVGVQAARDYLVEHRDIAAVDPRWHELMLWTAVWSGQSAAAFESLFKAAQSAEPLYWDFYFAGIEYNLPRWRGSVEAVERFASEAAARLPGKHRDSYYAAMYWYAFDSGSQRSASDWKVDCNRWMKGLQEIVASYPDPWNINNAARFSNSCDHRKAARGFLAQIGESPLLVAWGTENTAAANFANFKAWTTLGPYYLSSAQDRPARNADFARFLVGRADQLLSSRDARAEELSALLYDIENFRVVLPSGTADSAALAKQESSLRKRLAVQ